MVEEIIIGNKKNDYMLIHPLHREFPSSIDYWDGNWIITDIQFRMDCFNGKYQAYLRSNEFERFRQELSEFVSGIRKVISFETMEEQLSFSLEVDSVDINKIVVWGIALDRAGVGNKLEFNYKFERRQLPGIIKEVDEILTKFPVIGLPSS
jgi:hypothetical protein